MRRKRDESVQKMNDFIAQQRKEVYEQAIAEGATPDEIAAFLKSAGIIPPAEQAPRLPRAALPDPQYPFDEYLSDDELPPLRLARETDPDPPPKPRL
jgi:hypothetical protein